MKKYLLMALGAILLVGAIAAHAVAAEKDFGFREGWGGAPAAVDTNPGFDRPWDVAADVHPGFAPPGIEAVIGADGKIRFYETDNGFAPVADECKQTLEEAEARAKAEGWRRLGDFREPENVVLVAGYLAQRMGKPVSGDMVSAFDRGPEGLLMLTDKGCVVGIMGGLKETIDKALTEFRNSVPAA